MAQGVPTISPPSLSLRLGLALAVALLFSLPWFVWADLQLQDSLFRLRRNLSPGPVPPPDVVIVGIDEETLRRHPEPLALFHQPIGAFLQAMASARPAAVGLDLALPDRSIEALLPGRDAALLRGLLSMRSVAPVILGRVTGADGRPRGLHPPFEAAVGQDRVGYLLFQEDTDRRIRRFEQRLQLQGGSISTFAGLLAETRGIQARNGTLDMALGPAFDFVPLHQVLAWREAGQVEALQATFGGKLVLLGSVLPFEDRVKLAVHLAAWEPHDTGTTPGVVLQAHTLRCLLAGRVLVPMPAWAQALAVFTAALAGFALGHRRIPGFSAVLLILPLLPASSYGALTLGWTVPVVGVGGALVAAFLLRAGYDLLQERRAADLARLRAEAEQEHLRNLALRDGLTGLANRRHLDERLAQEWQRCARSGRPVAVILADLDHFKRLNDTAGHQAGDTCLRQVSTALSAVVLRPCDLVARYGGEEFAVLLPETDEPGAVRVAERLREAVQALALPHPASPVAPHVTLSLGAAAWVPDTAQSTDQLLMEADRMLYESKEHGRNRVTAPSMLPLPPWP